MENQDATPLNQQYQPLQPQQPLPNSTAVLVLGILSIVLCWCWGIIGTTLGIIAIVLGNKAKRLFEENPGMFSMSSYNNMKAGRICAIVGLSLSAAYLIFIIIYFMIIGTALTMMPWDQMMKH